jgi:hypothetical protein
MNRKIAIALACLLFAFVAALATGAEKRMEPSFSGQRPIVSPAETNPCSVAGACW